MDSFEDLPLSPELVEALAAEGIETPTQLQVDTIPVILRGNDLVAVAGPGAGVLVATALPLLHRLGDEDRNHTALLILTATATRSVALAEALARLTAATPHRVASLDGAFAIPATAAVLVSTPEALSAALETGDVTLDVVESFLMDNGSALEATDRLGMAAAITEALPDGAQKVMVSLPFTDGLAAFVDSHFRRAVRVPPGAQALSNAPDRGALDMIVVEAPKVERLAGAIDAALMDGKQHAVVFVRSEDRLADVGDHLTMRGYVAGRPGNPDVPIWMAMDPLEVRNALKETEAEAAIFSLDVPSDEDALDRRHGGGLGGVVFAEAREVNHLRTVGRRAGYTFITVGLSEAKALPPRLDRLLTLLEETASAGHLDQRTELLSGLIERHGADTVAGALLETMAVHAQGIELPEPEIEMAKLFISLGKRDGIEAKDLVGAIAGTADIPGKLVGRIDLRESFSVVEVARSEAEGVIRAMNGKTIRGRATRVDFDRSERTGGGEALGRDDRRGGPRGRGGPPSRGGPRGRGGPSRGGPRGGGPRGGGKRRDG